MAKVLKDLVLAMIDATLILILLCLFFAWRVSSTLDGLVATFAQNLEVVAPLREDVQGMTAELAALRGDLQTVKSQTGVVSSATMTRIQTRVDQIDAKLTDARNRVANLQGAPERLMDQALQQASDKFTQSVIDIRNCTPPYNGIAES